MPRTSLAAGLLRQSRTAIADLTSLAVQATNLRAGAAPRPPAAAAADSRGPAAALSPSLVRAAAMVAERADQVAPSGRDLGGRGSPGKGLRIIAEAIADNVVDLTLRLAHARKTLEIYRETGELYYDQVNGRT